MFNATVRNGLSFHFIDPKRATRMNVKQLQSEHTLRFINLLLRACLNASGKSFHAFVPVSCGRNIVKLAWQCNRWPRIM